MKNIFIGLIMLCAIQNICAQADHVEYEPDEAYMMNMRKGMMGIEYIDPVVGYKGNRYYNNWTYGEILLTNDERITGLSLRYEEYLDQLLWLRGEFRVGVLCKACIKGFNLYDDSNNIIASFIKKRIRLPFENDSADCFFQILVKGEYSFYAFRKVSRLHDAPKLADDTRYYVFNNDQYEMIKLRTHDLLNVSFIDKMKMKSIIKSNEIRLRDNELEFIKAISLYNKQI
jgi:hypothetical protein